MVREPIVWQRFEWRSGADAYKFEIEQGGLFGTLSTPAKVVTLPMVAWEGLIESVKVARKQQSQPQSRAVSAGMPARSGSRWSEAEVDQLVESFKAGQPVAKLADIHARSAYAVEVQLTKLGLIETCDNEPSTTSRRDRLAEI
jgi:hypothetical protein